MSEPVKIAEDLLGRYIELTRWDKGPLNGMQMPWQCDLRTEAKLIERVSAAEAALADAEEENARLRADLQQGEMQEHFQQDKYGFRILTKEGFNALIAARSKAPEGAQE